MTNIIALGTGSAFTMNNWQTNFIIQRNNKNLMVDCGSDIRWSLKSQSFSFKDIDAVYISHGHGDHAGGLEFLGFTRYFTRKAMIDNNVPNPLPLPHLFCERNVLRSLWDHTLRGGMEGLEGIDANIETYFNIHPIERNHSFSWEGLSFDIVQSVHISAKYCIVDSFGIMFRDDDGTRIYMTTDVQFSPESSMMAYYDESNVIIHDCETLYKSGVHAHYDNLKTLPDHIKNKILLVHYQDNVVQDYDNWKTKAKEDGFIGFGCPGILYSTGKIVPVENVVVTHQNVW
jgi:ribonuclease BN (tRNA processing enzyme)